MAGIAAPLIDEEEDGDSRDGEDYYEEEIADFCHFLLSETSAAPLHRVFAARGDAAADAFQQTTTHELNIVYNAQLSNLRVSLAASYEVF